MAAQLAKPSLFHKFLQSETGPKTVHFWVSTCIVSIILIYRHPFLNGD